MNIRVGMICTAQGKTYPATALVHANDVNTARVFAETHAKLNGAESVEFPISWKLLPRKWQLWFLEHGVYSF
jgi:hypothetical protein